RGSRLSIADAAGASAFFMRVWRRNSPSGGIRCDIRSKRNATSQSLLISYAPVKASRSCYTNVKTALTHASQRVEVGELVFGLPRDALFFAWTAHGAEVAPGARALGRRGGQESVLDGAIDDRERLQPLTARVVVDRNLVLDETAGRRAVEQPAGRHFFLQPLPHCGAVENRLQHRPSTDDEIRRRPVLPGLVIGDAEHVEVGAMLDEIDRSVQDEPAVDDDGLAQAAGIAALVAEAKAELEVRRSPHTAVGELLHPDAEVAPQ